MPISNPYVSSEKIKYLFIDGGSLDSLLENLSVGLFNNEKIEINYQKLAEGYSKIFYYDCYPAQKPAESDADYKTRIEPKEQLFNSLKSLDGFHLYEGTARYRDKKRGQEQKQVDIMIAVDMLTHSFRRNMHAATLLTGDLDFKPLIDALVQEGMHVSLWYPKGRANCELVDAADSRRALTINEISAWLANSSSQPMLPTLERAKSLLQPVYIPDQSWHFLEKIDPATYEACFWTKEGTYCAQVSVQGGGKRIYTHNNLDQLKFYVQNIYGTNVIRESIL